MAGKARASWIGWRTVRRGVDAALGETEGVPTYSVDGVRVALPPGAHHFRRIVECARCGRTVIDYRHPVYRRRDLHADRSLICAECAQLPPAGDNHDRPPEA